MQGKENLRAKEVAEYMGIGKSTVWLYAKRGLITPIKLSDNVTVFKKDEIDRFIESITEEEEKKKWKDQS